MLRTLGDLAMLAATSSFVAFVILYHLLADWRATRMGRHVMTFMLLCAIILVYVAFSTAFGPLPDGARLWVRLALYGALAGVGWSQVVLLVREQNRGRKTTIGKHHKP